MSRILADARFAIRLLLRSPVFAVTLLVVLVAGIGATTAMFSITDSLLLRPLPYRDPEQLTMIWGVQPRVDPSPASIPDFLDWREQATTFQSMSATDYDSFSLSSEGAKPESLPGASVSGDFFSVFGVAALEGRLLGTADDHVGGARVAVISASLWHRRFGSDPLVVGRSITLNSEGYTVIGIAPEGFRFSGPYSDGCDVWVPLSIGHSRWMVEAGNGRGSHFLHVIGRRKPGVSVEQAQAQLAGIAKSLEEAHPETNTRRGVRVLDLQEALVGDSREGILVLFVAVGLVFLIVCANVANLLLTRAAARRGEMAARAALGASTRRLVAQLVVETLVVFGIAALGGAALAYFIVDFLAHGIIRGSGAYTIPVRVDGAALLFSLGLATTCGLVFGLVPAMEAARVEPQTVLKESAARAGTSRSQRIVRGGLVVAQIALAFALLAGSGLALRSFVKTASTLPGFDPTNVATARITLPAKKYDTQESVAAFYRETAARLAALPGVEAVGADSTMPMSRSNSNGAFQIEGRPEWSRSDQPLLERNVVTPGFFAAMGIPLLRGRDFTATDDAHGRRVIIISQAMVDRFFPGEDPIGRRIDWGDNESSDQEHTWREIIGVSGDVHRRTLSRPFDNEAYVPIAQHTNRWLVFAVRSPRASALLQEFPGVVAGIDPELAVADRRLMEARVADSIGHERFLTLLLGAFALVALFLATLGVFGLVSYSTTQRTRELGLRMALGSSPAALVGLVVRGGLRLVGGGLVLGFAGALVVGRLLATRVSGVAPFDLAIYLAIPALLGVVGMLASLIPAWRVVRIPPGVALRYE